MYDIPSTGVTTFFAENIGALLLGSAIAGYQVLNGGDAAEAAAYANIPGLLLGFKNLVDNTAGKLGWSDASKYAPLAVSGALTAALLGKLDFVSSADALKYSAYWLLGNAAGMYLVPDKAMEGWGATFKGDAEFQMVKLMGQCLGTYGLFLYKLSEGASATEAIGYSWALGTACNIDASYISKYSVSPEDKNRFWLAVGAVGAAALIM